MATRLTTIQIVGQIKSELDRLLESESELAQDLTEGPKAPTRVDVVQTETKICVFVEVPGVAPEDLDVTASGGRVTVTGEKIASDRAVKSGSFLCVERRWGRIERSVELAATVNPRQGRAVLDHGVLRIEFPVLADQRNRPFQLQVERAEGGDRE